MAPLITVVTPTWDRDDFVLRAIFSVALQDYKPVQHIVVSDGPNPALRKRLRLVARAFPHAGYELVYEELPEHPPKARWGHFARLKGIELAKGDYIAYLDDDDELMPDHLSSLMQLLTNTPDVGFAYSQILLKDPGNPHISGTDPPVYSEISTSVIAHRKEILKTATWRDEGQDTIDWDIAKRWMEAGIKWKFCGAVTAHAHRDGPNASSDRPRELG